MRFFFVILFAILACFSSVSMAAKPAKQNPLAVKRLLRTIHAASNASGEERVPLVPGPLKELAEVGKSAQAKVSETLKVALKRKSELELRVSPENIAYEQTRAAFLYRQTAEMLIAIMINAHPPLTSPQIEKLLRRMLEQVDHFVLASVLLDFFKWDVPEKLAAKYHQVYLEMLVKEGATPVIVFSLWNGLFSPSTVVKNLNDFVTLYNEKRPTTQTTVLQTLEEYYGTDKALARALSIMKLRDLHKEWVKRLAKRYTFDTLFEHLRPKNGDQDWNFDTLILFAEFAGTRRTLLPTLMTKFGGVHKLAPILAAQSKWGFAAKVLHRELVQAFLDEGLKLHDVFELLNPKSAERWHFHTLYLYDKIASRSRYLLEFLVVKAGGIDKLALILAEAKQWDNRAHTLQEDLAWSLVLHGYTNVQVIPLLKLDERDESELTPIVTDTFRVFVDLTNKVKSRELKSEVNVDWTKVLAFYRKTRQSKCLKGIKNCDTLNAPGDTPSST